MRKLLLLSILLNVIVFAEPVTEPILEYKKIEIGTFNNRINELEQLNNVNTNTITIDEDDFDFAEAQEKLLNTSYAGGGSGSIRGIGKAINLNALTETMDDYYNVFNKASAQSLNAISRAADSATATASIAGAISGKFINNSGKAVLGSNIQLILTKLLAMQKRVDDLKQYKRYLDEIKTLSKDDLMNLKRIDKTLIKLDEIVSEGFDLEEKTISYIDLIKKSDLTTWDGWDQLISGSVHVRNLNEEVLERTTGEEAIQILRNINNAKESIRNITPENATQELTKLNSQITLLLTMFEKYMSDTAIKTTQELITENKKVEEEIAMKRTQQETMKVLQDYKDQLKKTVKVTPLRKKFVGDD